MCKRFVLYWGLFCLGISFFPESALAWAVTPFSISNQHPLVQIYGLPAADAAHLTPQSRTTARLSIDVANHFVNANAAGEKLTIDGESYRFTLALRFGLSERTEVGLDLPYIMYREGFLDGSIEKFHETFDYSSLLRDQVEPNQLLIRYQRNGVDIIRMDDSAEGIGDIRLTAGRRLYRNNNETAIVSLRGSLKLPTGDENRLLGSGSTDLALSLAASQLWKVIGELGLYGTGGILLMSKGEFLSEQQRKIVGFGTLGLGWRPRRLLVLKLQLDAHTPFYRDSALNELTDPGLQGSLGFTLCFTPDTSLDLAVVENLIKATSPDVAFQLALSTRF